MSTFRIAAEPPRTAASGPYLGPGYVRPRSYRVAREQNELAARRLVLPGVSLLIPARNEEVVLDHTLATMSALRYPATRLLNDRKAYAQMSSAPSTCPHVDERRFYARGTRFWCGPTGSQIAPNSFRMRRSARRSDGRDS